MESVLAVANESIDELFTWTTLGTLWGSALATFVVGNAVGALFAFWKRAVPYIRLWVAFLVALGIHIAFAWIATGDNRKWVVAVFNGFLVFTTAMGLNEGIDKLPKKPPLVSTWLRP